MKQSEVTQALNRACAFYRSLNKLDIQTDFAEVLMGFLITERRRARHSVKPAVVNADASAWLQPVGAKVNYSSGNSRYQLIITQNREM